MLINSEKVPKYFSSAFLEEYGECLEQKTLCCNHCTAKPSLLVRSPESSLDGKNLRKYTLDDCQNVSELLN